MEDRKFSSVARHYIDTGYPDKLTQDSIAEIVDKYIVLLSRQPIISFDKNAEYVRDQLVNSLVQMKGCTPQEAFNNLFLFYRSTTHASNFTAMYYNCLECMPLQTPTLLEIKRMWINNFPFEKVMYDIIDALNPLLSCIPYDTKVRNEERKKAEGSLLLDIRFKGCTINLDSSLTRYYEEINEYKKNTSYLMKEEDAEVINRMGTTHEILYDNCLLSIKVLSEIDNKMFYNMSKQIYYYLEEIKNDRDEVRILASKLWSIIDCYNTTVSIDNAN
jgi:hypothetical protein